MRLRNKFLPYKVDILLGEDATYTISNPRDYKQSLLIG